MAAGVWTVISAGPVTVGGLLVPPGGGGGADEAGRLNAAMTRLMQSCWMYPWVSRRSFVPGDKKEVISQVLMSQRLPKPEGPLLPEGTLVPWKMLPLPRNTAPFRITESS